MHTILYRTGAKMLHLTGPDSWDEVSVKQWLEYVSWQIKLGGSNAGLLFLICLWYGLKRSRLALFDDEQKLRLTGLIAFTHQRPSRWMVPQIRYRGRTYVGPGDRLEHLTFGEFVFADAARQRYQAGGKREDLVELTSVLYRPSPWPWQKNHAGGRTAFERQGLDGQIARLSGLPDSILEGNLINFLGCLDPLPESFSNLFRPATDQAETDGGGWLAVGLSMARQTGVFGTFHQLETTNLYLVFSTLDSMMKEAKKLEESARK